MRNTFNIQTFVIFSFFAISLLFGVVRAVPPTAAELVFDDSQRSFTVQLTPPETVAKTSLYYVDAENNIDAVVNGNAGEPMFAKTCSTGGTCVPDTVTYGIVKAYIPEENWLYIVKFQVTGGFTILEETVFNDILPGSVNPDDYVGQPPEEVLLQLSSAEQDWLKNPTAIEPTLTPLPTEAEATEEATPEPESLQRQSLAAPMQLNAVAASLTPSPTPAAPVVPNVCTDGAGWVNGYVASETVQGLQQNGLPVPFYRTSPSYGFNDPDDVYYSLGLGGTIVYTFPGQIDDVPAAPDFMIYEVTLGRVTYPEEKATVEVSQDGTTWFTLPQVASSRSPLGVTAFDFSATGLPWIQYVRLTDTTVPPFGIPEADGFDVNAIGAQNQDCTTVPTATLTPSPTLSPTLTPTITLTPSPTPAPPVDPLACVEGVGYLNEYVEGTITTQQNGLPVPAYRANPSYAFGAPDALYHTAGIGGTATYKFTGVVQNIPGTDFSMYETTLGRATYPIERAEIEVSMDGTTWFTLSTIATSRASVLGVTDVDFNETGLSEIQFIRINDITVPPFGIPEADGYDINSVVALSQTCPAPTSGLLTIRKFNTTGTTSPGGEVNYVLEVKAEEDDVENVEVLDLPPQDFKYIGGSWTAVSSDASRGVDGNLKAGGITTEPTYASPGTWNLGNMKAGETVTLTYRARVGGGVEGGTYGDLAWTQGAQGTVVGEGIASSYVNNEFVGSEVVIAATTQTSASIDVRREETRTETRQGDVLGASTGLPRTGADAVWLSVATFLATLGALALFAGIYVLFLSKKVGIQSLLVIFMLTAAVGLVQAQAITTIRISVPLDKINTNNFKITFVTMDSEGRAVTVRCLKKGPSDGAFVQYGPNIIVQPGGNSGVCNVDSSVVGTSGANYQFQASAQAGADPVVFSQVVGTSFNNQAPGTPVEYRKDTIGCTYRINFRAANDAGKTKKVEIYRSENTSFTADGGTRVGEVAVNSGEYRQFENTPECGKKFYYVVRAFDEFGNGSGLTGDSEVTVTTTTTTTGGTTTGAAGTATGDTGGAIAVEGGAVAADPGAGGIEGGEDGEPGDVDGADDAADGAEGEDQEEVLGENESSEDEKQRAEQRMNIILGAIIAGVLGILAYVFAKNRARK